MQAITLSEITYQIDEAIEAFFGGEIFWVKAEITDVKKYPQKKWCFVTLVEKRGEQICAKLKANIWSTGYAAVQKFEHLAQQSFENGLEIICAITIKHHPVYGISAEIIDIDTSFSIGKIIEERALTLQKLVTTMPKDIRLQDGFYYTTNNTLPMPNIPQRIALVTATNSDGYRDFEQEVNNNIYGYKFKLDFYAVNVQGEEGAKTIFNALNTIKENASKYDIVALVRGGGSQLDFKPFNDFEVCALIATFPIPVLTGIGHDSNTSIADLMGTQYKTPTKVANFIVTTVLEFEQNLLYMQEQIVSKYQQRWLQETTYVQQIKRLLNASNPSLLLKKGYAILEQNSKIITSVKQLEKGLPISAQLGDGSVILKLSNEEL